LTLPAASLAMPAALSVFPLMLSSFRGSDDPSDQQDILKNVPNYSS
jgi:hypothetical protein